MRAALRDAMRSRDRVATAALRSALAALDAAEAVDPAGAGLRVVEHGRIAGTVGGLGAAEVPRRTLAEADVRALVAREVADRRTAAADYRAHAQPAEAARLEAEAAVLAAMLREQPVADAER